MRSWLGNSCVARPLAEHREGLQARSQCQGMSQLASHFPLCLTCTHRCSAKFLCRNSHIGFSSEQAHCWRNAWTEVFTMPKRLKGFILQLRELDTGKYIVSWGCATSKSNSSIVLRPCKLGSKPWWSAGWGSPSHHSQESPCAGLFSPMHDPTTRVFLPLCLKVIFLNSGLTKASTGLLMRQNWPWHMTEHRGSVSSRTSNLTPGRHQEHEPWVDVSNNLLFRGGL